MDSNKGSRPSVILDYAEDQKQLHGGNSKTLKDVEEKDKKVMVETKPAQAELDQGKPSLGDPSQDKPAQEELPQVSVVHQASGAVVEAENKPEEMEGEEASEGSSGPMNNRNRDGNAQQQPPQEASMPEGSRTLHAGAMMIVHYHRPRFTHSQLQDLENLFQVTPFPSLRTRKDLARVMGVPEAYVMDWFQDRREVFRRNSRMLMFSDAPHASYKNYP